MPIKYVQKITREMVQAEPRAYFVFGDNLARTGLGGQAGAMRGEPNAIGVATKRAPGMDDADFFSDTAECRDYVLADIKKIRDALEDDETVYVPAAGLGTGLSELPKRAPKLAQLLVDEFRRLPGDPCPWPDVIGYDSRGLVAYKGFEQNLRCRDFQYAIGETFEMDGEIEACERGFHACTYPLGIFSYYAPALSRFAEVVLCGQLGFHGDDSKVAAAKITISAELKIPELVSRAVAWVMSRAFPEGESATGYQGAASATGYQGAASATGDQGAASATGYQGAASATGTKGAASATGDQGAASATGTKGAASATGYQGAASATGDQGAASATGTKGAASATGDQGAASATGYQGAASATGTKGAASATGDQGAASATGTRGAASATGTRGAASATGFHGKAMGKDGNALFLVYRREDYSDRHGEILHAWAGIVGKDGILSDTWYTLDATGRPVAIGG